MPICSLVSHVRGDLALSLRLQAPIRATEVEMSDAIAEAIAKALQRRAFDECEMIASKGATVWPLRVC